jgi:antitoxin VapB
MAFHIRDPEADSLVRELARREGVGLTEAVKIAVRDRLAQADARPSPREAIRKIQAELARYPETGLKADKAFFDEMSGD